MRVTVIADQQASQDVRPLAPQVKEAWLRSQSNADVRVFATSSVSAGAHVAWNFNGEVESHERNGRLISIPDDSVSSSEKAGEQFAAALTEGDSRIPISLPLFSTFDLGFSFLRAAYAALYGGDDTDAEATVSPSGMNSSKISAAFAKRFDCDEYVHLLGRLKPLTQGKEILLGFERPLPLTGMHGMSGAAAIARFLDGSVAQTLESEVAHFVHRLSSIGRPLLGMSGCDTSGDVSRVLRRFVRDDAAGSGGGLGLALLLLGAKAVPNAQIFYDDQDLSSTIDASDVAVVVQHTLDGRTLETTPVAGAVQAGINSAVPVIVIVNERIMGAREMAGTGIAACYEVGLNGIGPTVERIARSWRV